MAKQAILINWENYKMREPAEVRVVSSVAKAQTEGWEFRRRRNRKFSVVTLEDLSRLV